MTTVSGSGRPEPASGLLCALNSTVTMGLIVTAGRVSECPPYARRMGLLGLPFEDVQKRLVGLGWRVLWLPDQHQ